MKDLFKKGKRALHILAAHRYTTIAGMLSFFFIMSFVPFLFWLLLLLGGAGLGAEQILDLELIGWAKELLLLVIKNAEDVQGSGVGLVFLITTLWSGSAFFYHLRKSGEILYDFNRTKGGLRARILALVFTLAVLLFFAAAVGGFLFFTYLLKRLPKALFYFSEYSVIFMMGLLAAWILNSYILPFHAKPLKTLPGSLLTTLLWMAAATLFLLYYKLSHKEKLYGALSLVIVFFIFIYWMMICFTTGAVFNRHRMKKREQKNS